MHPASDTPGAQHGGPASFRSRRHALFTLPAHDRLQKKKNFKGSSERCLGGKCQANDHAGKEWKCKLCCSAGFSLTFLTYGRICKVDLQQHKVLDLYAS